MNFFLLIFLLSGCGITESLKGKFDLEMSGAYISPPSAAGTNEPDIQTFTLASILFSSDSGESLELLEASKEVKINNRPQIIFSRDIGEFADRSFNRIDITFSPQVETRGRFEKKIPLTLTQNRVSHSEAITLSASKTLTGKIDVNWRNTILRDNEAKTETVSEPSLSFKFE